MVKFDLRSEKDSSKEEKNKRFLSILGYITFELCAKIEFEDRRLIEYERQVNFFEEIATV